ncbi:MAG: hypothetical protein UT00_C0003G0002 [Parcubacteria group bacterium GW2011_GWA1_38_7]|nr:MAG: hypothetical protein UT00_C0003G0002 [Parcubacteria group bacterium GW2011_GWA1_38_7]
MRLRLMDRGTATSVAYDTVENEKIYERAVVCIRESDRIYKVISISSSERDESIYAFFNYCTRNDAHIVRFEHRNRRGGVQKIDPSQTTHEFIVDSNAKLSIHKSGFVQLSGNKIESGVDDMTGKPKGIGVFSSPLDTPIESGPTFGFQCWGIDKGFTELTSRKKGVQYIILDKAENDFRSREIEKNKQPNTYVLEFFVFPKAASSYVYEYRDRGPHINHVVHNYLHEPGALFAHPVVDLRFFGGVIAISPFWNWTGFADDSEFGYCIGSPGGADSIHDKTKAGYQFFLLCPRSIPALQNKAEKFDKLERE